ncbi:MAG TPA: heavy metal translocating P-type ATPase [Elusimicrobiales bacterium]|nr:heavy metal translocating P-type ATPase [Elusimicrobiales bacterium]
MEKNHVSSELRKAVIPLEGVHCASCVARVEAAITAVAGVRRVSVHLPSKTAFVSYDPALTGARELRGAIDSAGYKALAFSDSASAAGAEGVSFEELEREQRYYLSRLLWSAAAAFVILLDMFLDLSPYTLFLAAAFSWTFCGWHFHAGLLRSLRARTADMNTLVSLSTTVAWSYSAALLFAPALFGPGAHAHPQWHEVAVLVFFINLGRWLEARSRTGAGRAVSSLLQMAPKFARVVRGGEEKTVPAAAVVPGDLVLLRPGEQVPADGSVLRGSSAVDESLLTGESVPAEKGPGDRLYAGTMNTSGSLEFEAEGVGEDMVLMKIAASVRESQAAKGSVQKLVDSISAWFVPAVFLAAVLAAGLWLHFAGFGRAAMVFAAVLAVACPCAMGLAVPMAVAVGFARAARAGVLINNSDILERVSRVDTVILDKTGTLTEGRLSVAEVRPRGVGEKEFAALLLAAEAGSEHPFAAALRAHAPWKGVKPPAHSAFKAAAGKGVECSVGGGKVLAGSFKWLEELGLEVPAADRDAVADSAVSVLGLARGGEYLGFAALADTLRPGAAALAEELRAMGIEPVIASGDRDQAVAAAAAPLRIKSIYSGIFPEEKKAIVARYKALGRKVAMVGDGFNDAAALSEADIGIAMRSGTDIAIQAGDMTLMKNDLAGVVDAIKISRAIKRVINQNLGWAFGYNMLLIPLAAGALYPLTGLLLTPWMAGAAMALSSVSVVMNSLRLRSMKI